MVNRTARSDTPALRVFERTVAARAPLYALIDAARVSEGPYEARRAGVQCESLFAGDFGEMVKGVAPHLVEFKRQSSFYRWWFEQWGKSIGVLVEVPVMLSVVAIVNRTRGWYSRVESTA